MESTVFAGIAAVLLGVIFYFVPFHLQKKGKLILAAGAVIIASLSLVIEVLYGIVGGLAALMLLSAAASLILKGRYGLFEDQPVRRQYQFEDEKINSAGAELASAEEVHGYEKRADAVIGPDNLLEEIDELEGGSSVLAHQNELERPIESVLEELAELDETEGWGKDDGGQSETGAQHFLALEQLTEAGSEKNEEKKEAKEEKGETLLNDKRPGRLEMIFNEMDETEKL